MSVCLSVRRVSYRFLSIFVSVMFVGIVSSAVMNKFTRCSDEKIDDVT